MPFGGMTVGLQLCDDDAEPVLKPFPGMILFATARDRHLEHFAQLLIFICSLVLSPTPL